MTRKAGLVLALAAALPLLGCGSGDSVTADQSIEKQLQDAKSANKGAAPSGQSGRKNTMLKTTDKPATGDKPAGGPQTGAPTAPNGGSTEQGGG